MKVLVTGLAGASLGTEILKSLSRAGTYMVYGCDISPIAYGLFDSRLQGAFVVDKNNYIDSVIDLCKTNKISHIIPGGEQPMALLANAHEQLAKDGIQVASNTPEIVKLFSDKATTFDFLANKGFEIPRTIRVETAADLDGFSFPCIVKPSAGTGGSDSVFLATSKEECLLYVELLKRNKRQVIVQEYIDLNEGEFTIGVLSDTHEKIIGSIAMQRVFNSKLSVAYRGEKGLISSGYSQGLIADFKHIRRQAERIAVAAGSRGPLNIQGRVRNGVLVPFEINPRFSASTYLRTLAGFNEVDLFLQHLISGNVSFDQPIREGYYMRTFDEMYIPQTAGKP